MRFVFSLLAAATIVAGLDGQAKADDQTALGAGNATSAATAGASGLIGSALERIRLETAKLNDSVVRRQTIDALFNAQTCIRHRANLTAAAKQAIIDRLVAAGLLGAHDGDSFPGGLVAGVFPPVRDDGTACPHLPQPIFAAPGGGQHHAYPGGLIVHEAFNLRSALSFADNYRAAAGFRGADGLPRVGPIGEPISRKPSININEDELRAAPVWHDWAKSIVFQWNADGTLFRELGIAGTGGHHILGVAETIARGLPAELILVQVSAHTPPNTDNEANVVRWLRAASIIAGVDPVARGLLTVASDGNLHLPPVRRLGDVDLLAGGEDNLLVEYTIHNLSDADWVYAEPAVTESVIVLRKLAPSYGYDPADVARFTTHFRNVVLANLGAEHLQIVYANEGLAGVARDLNLLRGKGLI